MQPVRILPSGPRRLVGAASQPHIEHTTKSRFSFDYSIYQIRILNPCSFRIAVKDVIWYQACVPSPQPAAGAKGPTVTLANALWLNLITAFDQL